MSNKGKFDTKDYLFSLNYGSKCVWKYDEYGRFHTSCHVLTKHDYKKGDICLFCGREIEVKRYEQFS